MYNEIEDKTRKKVQTVQLILKATGKFGLIEFVCLTFLAIYCINLNNTLIPFLLLPVALIHMVKAKHNFAPLMYLAAFSIVYSLCVYLYDFITNSKIIVMYLVFPSCFYIIGSYVSEGDVNFKKTTRVLLIVIVSFAVFGYLSLSKTLSAFGSIDALTTALNGRVVLNFWNDNPIAATGLNTYLSLGLSLFGTLFLSNKGSSKLVKTICLAAFVISVYSVVTLGNRTGALITTVSIVMVYLFAERITAEKILRSIIFLLLAILMTLLYQSNFVSLKQTYEDSLLYSRFHQTAVMEDPRVGAWNASFWGLFQHPMGGRLTHLPLVKFAHNMWLDVGYTAGIVPFLLLLIFTGLAVKALIVFVRSDAPVILKGILIGLFTAFFITFFFEPILEGWFAYFAIFCLVFGMIQRINFEKKSNNKVPPNGVAFSITTQMP